MAYIYIYTNVLFVIKVHGERSIGSIFSNSESFPPIFREILHYLLKLLKVKQGRCYENSNPVVILYAVKQLIKKKKSSPLSIKVKKVHSYSVISYFAV